MKLKWTCEECGATGPFDETALWNPHDCKSRGPFDEVSSLSIEPLAAQQNTDHENRTQDGQA